MPTARDGYTRDYSYNYWGTDDARVISDIIIDSNDIVSYGTITYEPFLTSQSDLSSIYPFVLTHGSPTLMVTAWTLS